MITSGNSLDKLTDTQIEKRPPSGSGTFTYVDISSIDRDTKRIVSPSTIPVFDAPSRARQVLKAGDVLVSMTRPNLNAVALVPSELDGAIGSTGFHVLRALNTEPRFLYYAVQTTGFIDAMCQKVQGALYPAVRPKDISSFLLPPFSLPHQRRIVAEIEKQFTRLEAGVSALKRVQAKLKRYRAAVLKAACEGKLVPTEAALARAGSRRSEVGGRTGFETGEQLLKRILADRRKNWLAHRSLGGGGTDRGQYKEPAAPDISNLPPLPEGWTWASIDQLSSHITSGSRDWSQYYGRGNGTFVLAQNIRPMRLDLSERQSVAAPKGDAETERTRIRIDDLLVTIVGAKTGDVCRVPSPLDDHFVCQSVALLRPIEPAMSKFEELFLASQENGQAQWKKFIYGQGRPHLGFDQIRVTAIPLPPLAEQTRIVAEVERRLSVVEELEATVSANLQRATRLRQAVLQKAFEGKLTGDAKPRQSEKELL